MPSINGIIETALYVADLPRAANFYQTVLGLRPLLNEPGRLIALQAGDHQVLLLFARGASATPNPAPQGGTIPPHDATGQIHVGLAIAESDLPAWRSHLRSHNVPIEAQIPGPQGGTSLYFRDPDQNLVELLTPGIWPIY